MTIILDLKCEKCGTQWSQKVEDQTKVILKCPNCKKENG